jgi:hypothetical protein
LMGGDRGEGEVIIPPPPLILPPPGGGGLGLSFVRLGTWRRVSLAAIVMPVF